MGNLGDVILFINNLYTTSGSCRRADCPNIVFMAFLGFLLRNMMSKRLRGLLNLNCLIFLQKKFPYFELDVHSSFISEVIGYGQYVCLSYALPFFYSDEMLIPLIRVTIVIFEVSLLFLIQ